MKNYLGIYLQIISTCTCIELHFTKYEIEIRFLKDIHFYLRFLSDFKSQLKLQLSTNCSHKYYVPRDLDLGGGVLKCFQNCNIDFQWF